MQRLRRRIPSLPALVLLLVAVSTVVLIGRVRTHAEGAGAPASVSIGAKPVGPPIPASFVGLSFEYRTLPVYAGSDPKAINPVFEQLVRNLAPGQQPSVRIGGDTTDWTWWPIAHMSRPLGVRYSLSRAWAAVAHRLAQDLNSALVLGVNLEVDSARVAAAEVNAFKHYIGAGHIRAVELGNEPELYGGFPWFVIHGRRYYGRPSSYHFAAFDQDFSRIAGAFPRVALAGPDSGSDRFLPNLGAFLHDQARVNLATVHRYPLKVCSAGKHVSIDQLLSRASSTGIGMAQGLAPYVRTAHAHRVPIRVDEMNAVSCGGEPGVSDTFATALWAPDALFALARIGVDGVNIHSRPGSSGELFSFSRSGDRWRAQVWPEYYGLMLFALAAPPGARLLTVSGASSGALRVWGTRGTDGKLRVLVINDGSGRRSVSLRIAGAQGVASVLRLRGPDVHAHGGVTLGGLSFGSSTASGQLSGSPQLEAVSVAAGRYRVSVPGASAALVMLNSAA